LDHHVFGGVCVAPIGRLDRLLKRLNEDLFGDPLLGVELKEGPDEVSIHGAPRFRDEKTGRGMVNRPTSVLSSISIWSATNGRRNRAKYSSPTSTTPTVGRAPPAPHLPRSTPLPAAVSGPRQARDVLDRDSDQPRSGSQFERAERP